MGGPMDRLAEARKQIVIAAGAIEDDDQLEALEEARRLIDEIQDSGTDGGSQPNREQV